MPAARYLGVVEVRSGGLVAAILACAAALLVPGASALAAVATDVAAAGDAPTALSPPGMTGMPREGSSLSASPGVWAGAEPIEYAYAWQRCDTSGGGCVEIPGVVQASYLLVPADVGATVRVVVTARNAAGEQSAASAPVAVDGRPPRNFAQARIVGEAIESVRLTIDVGTWGGTSPLVHTYAWQRCDAAGALCVDVPGAAGKTFLLTAGDIGSTLRALVTGTNVAGQLTVATPATGVVAGRPPVVSSPPSISGTAVDGQRHSAGRGTWSGTPVMGFAYAWLRCDAEGGQCAEIPDAQGQTHLLMAADVGATLRVRVTAANSVAQQAETSAPTPAIAASPPVGTVAPKILGTVAEGERLTAGPGTWTGTGPLAFAYRWQRCDPLTLGCTDIPAATGKTSLLTPEDVGAVLRVGVTASNVVGSATAYSWVTAPVAARPPSAPRKITGVGAGGAVTLDWVNNPESDVVAYRVYRQSGRDPWSDAPVAVVTASRFVDRPPLDGSTYSYRVTAVDATALAGAPSAAVSALASGQAPLAAAAGDIACDPASINFRDGLGTMASCRQAATAALLADADAVLPLGDLQYENAALENFALAYDRSWGVAKAHTHPAVGNHEYVTAGAAGYFDYFNGVGVANGPAGDRSKGYYSYNLGSWHVVVLNSNCSRVGGCGAGSPQERWLRADLAASANRCALAYWHHPRFSGGRYGNNAAVRPFWQALYEHRAEVVLSGHDHNYQRFAPQDAVGAADPTGPREFVVGTGGKGLYPLAVETANREAADGSTAGVLKLRLRADGYDWTFEPETGKTFTDSGSGACR